MIYKLISKNDFRDNCGFGLIAHINGKKSHDIVIKSINALVSMTHRGAIGADGKTGDGCGILVDLDKDFFEEALLKEQSIKIKDEFAIGQIFLDHEIDLVLPKIKKILKKESLNLTALRKVPLNKKILIHDDDLKPLYDDLNTPGYIAVLHKLYEKAKDGGTSDKEIFTTACNFIGLLNETKEKWDNFKKKKLSLTEDEILQKINQRNKAREEKNYKLADEIRNELLDKGILIEDKDGKTMWKIK